MMKAATVALDVSWTAVAALVLFMSVFVGVVAWTFLTEHPTPPLE